MTATRQVSVNFVQHVLSEQEIKQGCILNPSQIRWLENQLTQVMNERANLAYDPNQPITVFAQREAELMGQITAFSFILTAHQEVIASLQAEDNS